MMTFALLPLRLEGGVMIRPQRLWSSLRESFWFLPSLIVLVSIALAMAFIQADSTWNENGSPAGPACSVLVRPVWVVCYPRLPAP